jgi:Tfp pilus assembly protein PilX
MSRQPRGSALIAALIIIGVLALVTVATLQLANISKQASANDSRRLSQASCVDAARQYLLGRLRLFGIPPTSITLDQTVAMEAGNRVLRTAHIDTIGNTPVVTSVVALPSNLVSNSAAKARDISNLIAPPAMGAKVYRVVVACSDPLAGNMEMEFTFKYGL